MGNKGGVAVAFTYDDCTNFCFVGSHLAARAKRLKERAQNYRDIVEKMKGILLQKGSEFLHQYDYVFWGGDLNYRINLKDGPGYDTEGEFRTVLKMISDKQFDPLYENDQLREEKNHGRVFSGFKEAPIKFAPTYRMVRGHHDYSNKRFQSPSWTDRILWHTRAGMEKNVENLEYNGVFNMPQSDHRPVTARFKVKTNIPYLNVVRKGNFYGSENCDVHFGSISFTYNEELATIDASNLDADDDEDDADARHVIQKPEEATKKKDKKVSTMKKVTRYLFRSKKDTKEAKKEKKTGKEKQKRMSLVATLEQTMLGEDRNETKDLYLTLYSSFLEAPLTSDVITVPFDKETGEVSG